MIIKEISANAQSVRSVGELFGIEIEVESVYIPDDLSESIWNCIEDGSLRNSGVEFVSRPVTYADAMAGIDRFYEWDERHSYQHTLRTSTHVHYNVLGFETAELHSALVAYSIVEPLLFRVCGHEREENIYCVPWYRAKQGHLTAGLGDESVRDMQLSCKYSALYLEPVTRFGTVEFRGAPVFEDALELKFWIDLIRAVMTNGPKMGEAADVLELYDRRGADWFVHEVFGELAQKLKDICVDPFEDIIDDADSISAASECIDLPYTYKVTEWPVAAAVDGDQTAGYHRRAVSIPMYHVADEEPDYDEEGYDEENY